MFWVKTGQEEKAIEEIIKNFYGNVFYRNFLIETLFRKKGEVKVEIKYAFPGYIFISSKISNDEFMAQSKKFLYKYKAIIKLLCYGNTNEAAMKDEERAVLDFLWQEEECLKSSVGYTKGDHIIVTNGPFAGRESVIKGIDRHKRQAVVEVEFMGGIRRMTVGLEIVERLP